MPIGNSIPAKEVDEQQYKQTGNISDIEAKMGAEMEAMPLVPAEDLSPKEKAIGEQIRVAEEQLKVGSKQDEYVVTLSGILRDHYGMEFTGDIVEGSVRVDSIDDPGNGRYISNEYQFLQNHYKKIGDKQGLEDLRRGNITVAINSMNDPVNKSPEGIIDRAIGSFKDTKTFYADLKKKYKKIAINENNDLVLLKDGVWRREDPALLGAGNAIELSYELFKDLGDTAGTIPTIGTSIAGEMAGIKFGGKLGMVAGGTLGAGVGHYVKSVMSSIVGLDSRSHEEILMDAAGESMLALLGYGMGYTAIKGAKEGKAIASMVSKSFVAQKAAHILKESGKTMSKGARNILSNFMGFATGLSPNQVDDLFKYADTVVPEMNRISKLYGRESLQDLKRVAAKEANTRVHHLIRGFDDTVFSKFIDKEKALLKMPPIKEFFFDGKAAYREFFEGNAKKNLLGLFDDPIIGKLLEKGANGKYSVISPEKLKKFSGMNLGDINSTAALSKIRNELETFVTAMNKTRFSNLSGRNGAALALEARRSLDKFMVNCSGVSDQVQGILSPYSTGMKNKLVDSFHKLPGVGTKYKEMNKYFTDFLPDLKQAKKIMNNADTPMKIEEFANTILGGSVTARDRIKRMAAEQGKERILKKMYAAQTAINFMKVFPQPMNLSTLAKPAILIPAGATISTLSENAENETIQTFGPLIGGATTLLGAGLTVSMSPYLVGKYAKAGVVANKIWRRKSDQAAKLVKRGLLPPLLELNEQIKRLPLKLKRKALTDEESGGVILMHLLGPMLEQMNIDPPKEWE